MSFAQTTSSILKNQFQGDSFIASRTSGLYDLSLQVFMRSPSGQGILVKSFACSSIFIGSLILNTSSKQQGEPICFICYCFSAVTNPCMQLGITVHIIIHKHTAPYSQKFILNPVETRLSAQFTPLKLDTFLLTATTSHFHIQNGMTPTILT